MHGNDPVQGGSSGTSAARITWRRCVGYSLLVCLASGILGFVRPLWIAPPFFKFTVVIYVVLAWAGLVVLGIAARYRPLGSKAWLAAGIALNVVFSLVASALIIFLFVFGPSECKSVPTETMIVRYRCTWSLFYSVSGFTLYGLPYFPLMLQAEYGTSMGSSFG